MSNHDPMMRSSGRAPPSRWSTCRCRTTRITWRPGWRTSSTSAVPRLSVADGVLVVFGRGAPGLPEHLNGECDMALAGRLSLRVPHRVGYWYEQGSMVSPTGPLQAVRRALRRHHLRQRRRRRGAQGTAGRGRRRGPHPCRDPRFGAEQRRIDEDDLRRAQCRRARPRSSPRRTRSPRSIASTDQLYRDARHRHPARRPDRNRGSATGVRAFPKRPGWPMLHRLGQVQHRSPGDRGRDRRV